MKWKDFKVVTKIVMCFTIPLVLMAGTGVWS